MNRDVIRQVANVIAYVATVGFNYLSEARILEVGTGTNREIANRFQTDLLYFPANYAFSIWGLIYTFLLAFVVYQALPAQRENVHLRRLGYLFVVGSALNIGWITAFQSETFLLSQVIMLALLASLILAYVRMGIGKTATTTRDKWFIHVPFSIYLGWISAATLANTAYVLRDAQWETFMLNQQLITVVMLLITGGLAVAMLLRHQDIAYASVIVWAIAAIAVRHSTVTPLVVTVGTVAVVIVVTALVTIFNNRNQAPPLTASRAAG